MKKLFTFSILAVMLFTSSLAYAAPRRTQHRSSVHNTHNKRHRPAPSRRPHRTPTKEYHYNNRGQVVYVKEYVYVNRPHRNPPPPRHRAQPRRHYRR